MPLSTEEIENRSVFRSYRRTECLCSEGISRLHFSMHSHIMQLDMITGLHEISITQEGKLK